MAQSLLYLQFLNKRCCKVPVVTQMGCCALYQYKSLSDLTDPRFSDSVGFSMHLQYSRWRLPSQRDGQVEDGEHHGPLVVGEQVSDDGGRDGGVAGLSNAYQASGQHKQPIVLQEQTGFRQMLPLSINHELLYALHVYLWYSIWSFISEYLIPGESSPLPLQRIHSYTPSLLSSLSAYSAVSLHKSAHFYGTPQLGVDFPKLQRIKSKAWLQN